jgi:hypothetical protein
MVHTLNMIDILHIGSTAIAARNPNDSLIEEINTVSGMLMTARVVVVVLSETEMSAV